MEEPKPEESNHDDGGEAIRPMQLACPMHR